MITKRGNLARCPSHVGPVRSKTSPSGVLKTCRLGRKEKRLWRVGGGGSLVHTSPSCFQHFSPSRARTHLQESISLNTARLKVERSGTCSFRSILPLSSSTLFLLERLFIFLPTPASLIFFFFFYEFSLSSSTYTGEHRRLDTHERTHTRTVHRVCMRSRFSGPPLFGEATWKAFLSKITFNRRVLVLITDFTGKLQGTFLWAFKY